MNKGFTFDQIETEIACKTVIFKDIEQNPDVPEEYKNFIKQQLNILRGVWEKKIANAENKINIKKHRKYLENKFIGCPSYDMKVFYIIIIPEFL